MASLLPSALNALQLSNFAKRPGFGKDGKRMQVYANVFPLKFKASTKVTHYDVAITPTRTRPNVGDEAARAERRLPIAVCREVIQRLSVQHASLSECLAKGAFDGRKSLFLPGKYDFAPTPYLVILQPHTDGENARERAFEVKISFAQTIDLAALSDFASTRTQPSEMSQIAIQAVDILMRHEPTNQANMILSGQGRKFFGSASGIDIGQAAEVLRGFFMSVRPTLMGPILNLDQAFSPYFTSGNMLQVCSVLVGRGQNSSTDAGGRGGRGGRGGGGGGRGGRGGAFQQNTRPASTTFNDKEIREIRNKLRGASVRVTHRVDRRAYMIIGFGRPAGQETVSIRDGARPAGPTPRAVAAAAAAGNRINPARPEAPEVTMTLVQYFERKYNMKINPDLPCVIVKGNQKLPLETIELLRGSSIPPTKLTGEQAARMIDVARTSPQERKEAIEGIRQARGFDENNRLAAWNIQVGAAMEKIGARVLPPPQVIYNQAGKVKTPAVGKGSWNLVDTKFTKPATLNTWAVIVFQAFNPTSDANVRNFIATLVSQAKARGMNVTNATPVIHYCPNTNEDATEQALKDVCRPFVQDPKTRAPPSIVFLLWHDKGLYEQVKRQAAFNLPMAVVTQAVLLKNVPRDLGDPRAKNKLEQYLGNLLMKVNAKLSGQNWNVGPAHLPKISPKTMLMGADVTHPPRVKGSDAVAPSIAAVVATREASLQSVAAQVREQDGRKETIVALEQMTVLHIQAWVTANKAKPDAIIFFRDGVSEGQYSQVVDEEVTALKAAFRAIDATWKPKLTFIVCAKRHNIRFFASQQADMDRTSNLPPGTVVDTQITSPCVWDFYLQAHAGLIGTARPTHYIILLDENRFSPDEIQKLVNSLCYSFARATRSVSLVPMAYYADIVCTKTRSFAYADDASSIGTGHDAVAINTGHIQARLDTNPRLPAMWYI